jgi:hypothetical protein
MNGNQNKRHVENATLAAGVAQSRCSCDDGILLLPSPLLLLLLLLLLNREDSRAAAQQGNDDNDTVLSFLLAL